MLLRPAAPGYVAVLPAFSRTSHTSMGVKVRAGPAWPAKLPAITRSEPASSGSATTGMQVDPQLHHLQLATRPGERGGMEFLMQNARGRRHPLHVAGTDDAAVAGGVAVLDLAAVDDGHGLKAAMGVLPHAARMVGRLELGRAGVIQQQEGADVLAFVVVGEHRAHREAVAHPVGAGSSVQTEDLLHGVYSYCATPAGSFVIGLKIRAERWFR
ncbi:hypothetical protein G6F68_011629 [Rhizopus microsporus]|nr:hypothetical protein G6F68_011629 [Rhizopus microsporus]